MTPVHTRVLMPWFVQVIPFPYGAPHVRDPTLEIGDMIGDGEEGATKIKKPKNGYAKGIIDGCFKRYFPISLGIRRWSVLGKWTRQGKGGHTPPLPPQIGVARTYVLDISAITFGFCDENYIFWKLEKENKQGASY